MTREKEATAKSEKLSETSSSEMLLPIELDHLDTSDGEGGGKNLGDQAATVDVILKQPGGDSSDLTDIFASAKSSNADDVEGAVKTLGVSSLIPTANAEEFVDHILEAPPEFRYNLIPRTGNLMGDGDGELVRRYLILLGEVISSLSC